MITAFTSTGFVKKQSGCGVVTDFVHLFVELTDDEEGFKPSGGKINPSR